MKTVVLGLASLSLLALVARQSNSTRQSLWTPSEPAPAESRQGKISAHPEPDLSEASPAAHHREPNVERVIASIESEPDVDRRSEMLDQSVASLAPSELPAMLDALKGDARPAAAELGQLLLRRWVENDPSAAAEWAAQLPEGRVRRSSLELAATTWADSDLAAATDWVRRLPEGADRNAASLSLAYEAARTDPLMALELARALPLTRERDDLIAHAVSQWSGSDSATATMWAAMVPDPALRQRLLAAVAVGAAELDGAAAANLIAQMLGGTDDQDRAVIAVVQRWTQISPSAAASWIAQFPESAVRDAAAQTLIDVWASQDPRASGLWVRDLPDCSLRDVALGAYVQALAASDAIPEPSSSGSGSPAQPEGEDNLR